MINTTIRIWCDKCGGPQISYTPPLGALVRDAMVTAEERAVAAGWDAEGVYHMCPSCAREKKHGPAVWTKEAALAEMTRERDAYHWVVLELLDDKTPGEFAASVDWSALREGRILDAVLALPQATPQPSGNSGGFAAAAGILADTWDDESSEDAIRRIRDGTPPPEGKP